MANGVSPISMDYTGPPSLQLQRWAIRGKRNHCPATTLYPGRFHGCARIGSVPWHGEYRAEVGLPFKPV